MQMLPRHLLLATVVLAVCCAERQAVAVTLELQKAVAEQSDRSQQQRAMEQIQVRRQSRHRYVRPASVSWRDALRLAFAPAVATPRPHCPLVHVTYPPSRFRLPPPQVLA